MKQIHPGEEKLQQFVLEKNITDAGILDHIKNCEVCMKKIRVYEYLFEAVKEQSSPVFEFDLSEAVLAKLPKPVVKTAGENKIIYAIIASGIIFMTATWLFINDYLVFKITNSNLLYLLLTTLVIVFIFHSVDIFKNHQKKIKALDLI